MNIVDRTKICFHRDLARDPLTHAWVLNLYLNGERYPQTVCDYFQYEFAPTVELAEKLRKHERDEQKHEALFVHALEQIDKPVVILPREDVFNEIVRSFLPGTFHIVETDSKEKRREKLANFMAHAHCLEKRVARSLEYHGEACASVRKEAVAATVEKVCTDELRHVRYTRETIFELLPREQAGAVLDQHRRAEARANLNFSVRQVRAFLHAFGPQLPRYRRILYRLCASVMEGAEHYV